MTALQLIKVMVESDKKLSELAAEIPLFPQLLVNVRVSRKEDWEENSEIQQAVQKVESELGDAGRVFVRASGTEAVIRIMVEGKDKTKLEELANYIATIIENELG
jgi:phosphoglucosamine mutase